MDPWQIATEYFEELNAQHPVVVVASPPYLVFQKIRPICSESTRGWIKIQNDRTEIRFEPIVNLGENRK